MTYRDDIGPLSASVVRQLQGRIPYDELVAIIARITDLDDLKSIGRQAAAQMVDRIHVYALEPINGDNLIILPLSLAAHEAENEEGAGESGTFGEFAANSPDGGYCWDILEQRAEYPEFDDYLRSLDIDIEDEAAMAAARKEYDELSPYGWRPPRDDDPFDRTVWDEYCFNYGVAGGTLGYFNPPVAMYDVLPTSVLAHFAKIEPGTFGDTFVTFDPKDEYKIREHFTELGYILIRDDLLIAACYGEGPGLEKTRQRIAWYDEVEKLRTGLASPAKEVQ